MGMGCLSGKRIGGRAEKEVDSVVPDVADDHSSEKALAEADADGQDAPQYAARVGCALLLAAVLAAVGAGTTVCMIFFGQMNSLACFLCFIFLTLGSFVLMFASCASGLVARRRRVGAVPFAIMALGLLAFMVATAVQLCLRGPDAPPARFVGDVEELFGDSVDTGDSSFSEFRIPSLVATQATLVAFAEGRRGTTGVHGDFAPTELVFRSRPMAAAGEVPKPWSKLESLADLLTNSTYCKGATEADCLPVDCQRHMSNPAPAVTSPERGEVLMVFNCENTGTYAVQLKVAQEPGEKVVSVVGRLQMVLAAPPMGASWVGVGPPASLYMADENAVLVPLYYAWTRKPELFDGLDSYGMTLRYDLGSEEWSTPCGQYGGSKGQVNEHQYFSYGGEVWAFARTINYNPWTPRRTLLRRGGATGGDEACFEVVAEPRFLEQVQGCEGSVIATGESGSERVFYTGVDGSVLYRRKLQLFEAQAGAGADGRPSIEEWKPLATIHGGGAAYSALAVVDGGLLGILYERSDEAALSFHPNDIVLRRVDTSAPASRRLSQPGGLRGGRGQAQA